VCIHVALKRKMTHVGAAKVKEEHFRVLNKNESFATVLLISRQVIVNFSAVKHCKPCTSATKLQTVA
jgi:hypothetical protein